MDDSASPIWTLSGFGDEIAPDLETQLRVLAELGIRHLELRSIDGVNVLDLDDAQLDRADTLLRERGFRVSAIASPIGKVPFDEPFDRTVDRLQRALDIAGRLGVGLVRVFSFYVSPSEREDRLAETGERLARLAALANRSGIVLAHENEKGIVGEGDQACLSLLEAVASPALRAAFDPANFVQAGIRPYPDAYERLRPWIAYLQVKDARFADGEVTPAGEGDARLPELLAALARSRYSGFVSLEPHLASGSEPGGGPEGFARAALALRRLLEPIERLRVR